jgi:nodulation protein F
MTSEVEQSTLAIITEASHLDSTDVTRDTPLEELGIESLELTEIIMDLEDKHDIEIDLNTAEAWQSMKTVGDIIDAVQKLVSAKA